MFVMCDMYVKLPPDGSPIAVNKFTYLLTTDNNNNTFLPDSYFSTQFFLQRSEFRTVAK
jgi:hypothetical protein